MQGGIFSSTQIRILLALALLMVMLALASYTRLNFERVHYVNPVPATITVSGEGEVLAVPDVGKFSFSVTAEAKTVGEAQEMSGVKINDILAYLSEQGIDDKDIKTESYNLNPRWRYEERICPAGSYCPPGERVQDGFTVSQMVSVKIRDTKEAGSIIAGVGERGATNMSNLNFTVDDIEALREEARTKAIEDAKAKAGALAEQLGVRLVRITSYHEGGDYQQPYARSMMLDEAAGAGGFTAPDLPVGEESTIVRVNVNYEIR